MEGYKCDFCDEFFKEEPFGTIRAGDYDTYLTVGFGRKRMGYWKDACGHCWDRVQKAIDFEAIGPLREKEVQDAGA